MLRRMTRQIRAIAETARFRELYDAGWTITQLADHYRVSRGVITGAIEYLGLSRRVQASSIDWAPSEAEELASMSSLELAPAIRAVAAECRQRHYEQRRREPENTTQCNVARQKRRELARCQR